MESHLTDISRVIQLAVAPVFLLTAIATMIGAMSTRLGRIVDRRRVILARDEANQTSGLLSLVCCQFAAISLTSYF